MYLKEMTINFFPIIAFTIFTLQQNAVSPQHLSQVLGGWTWFVLINRPLLSVFNDVYSFQNVYWRENRFTAIELWPSVRCELHCILGLLPFMEASLSLGWGEVAYEVDAGPKITSVLSSPAPASTMRILAQLAERGGWLLHDLNSDADPDLLAHAVEDELSASSPGFSKDFARTLLPRSASKPVEVDPSWWNPRRWVTQFSHKLKHNEHNTISEVRAAVQAIRHFSSSPRNWHRRLAVISDAGAAIGCLSKGRSSSTLANALCRQAAAVICAADLRVYFRWVASAHNCADGPSRGSRYPGVATETLAKARHAWEAFARATAATS